MASDSAFIPVPGPKLLEFIGTVAVKWSVLEFLLDNMLYWASDPNDPDIPRFLKEEPTRRRWAQLKTILQQEHASHPGTTRMLALIGTALDIKGERDTIVHGVYGDPDGSKNEAIATLFKDNKVRSEWPVTADGVKAAAQKIDNLCRSILTHQIQNGQPLGNSILPNAWRHKDRK